MAPWRKRQMLGSIITISELIVAMFALRICATVVKYRYNYCIPERISSKERRGAFSLYCDNASEKQIGCKFDHNIGGYVMSKGIFSTVFAKARDLANEMTEHNTRVKKIF